ncbi:MAG TPA: cytochrome P450 [Micromonosporaceae bacterium]|nr:cytochrome P450 [Micromonosporaceae bacterium]
MRAHAPVHWHPPGELPGFWSLTRYEDIRAVYRDHRVFSSAHGVLLRPAKCGVDPGGGQTLALTDPPRHKQLRGLIADWFSARSIRALEDSIRSTVQTLLARAVARGECDFVHDVAARLSHHVICGLIGVPEADQENLFQWTNDAFNATDPAAQALAHQQVMQYFLDLMYQRMVEPTDDLVSTLVSGNVDGELLTEKEIFLNCENLIGATENGRLALIGGMLALIEHPDQWQRLHADRELMPAAVEEILRWTSSATHSMRTVTEPTALRNQRIEAGDRVVLWIPSANRDEEIFTDPDRFDIGRTPNRHLALGAGEHFCIGSILARAETRILLAELLSTVDRVELAGTVVPVHSTAVNGVEHLPVRMIAS